MRAVLIETAGDDVTRREGLGEKGEKEQDCQRRAKVEKDGEGGAFSRATGMNSRKALAAQFQNSAFVLGRG